MAPVRLNSVTVWRLNGSSGLSWELRDIYGPHLISWADILHFWHLSPSFIVKMPLSYSQQIVAVNMFFSFLVLLFFCLFLPYFSFSSASINLKA